jgi:hypothetical protein
MGIASFKVTNVHIIAETHTIDLLINVKYRYFLFLEIDADACRNVLRKPLSQSL